MKKVTINNEAPLTEKQIARLAIYSVSKYVLSNGKKYRVCKTEYSETPCEKCRFSDKGKMGTNCPRLPEQKNPVCFATNRPDKESVYFGKT